jgi:hypothetical protein
MVNPEEQHQIYMRESISNSVKGAKRFARARFDLVHKQMVYEFKVYLEIYDDKDFDYAYYEELCKNLAKENVELNTDVDFKTKSDQLYKALAHNLPGSDISIVINNGNVGLTTHYT